MRIRFKNSNINSEKGIALITVLLVTAVLVTVAVNFAFKIYISTARAGNFKDSLRAGLIAENGVDLARKAVEELLKRDPNLVMRDGALTLARSVGDTAVEVRVSDEKGKLSLRLIYQNGVSNDLIKEPYARLVKGLRLEDSIVDTLSDWVDPDELPRSSGAESHDYYRRLPKKYSSKNTYPDTLDELLLIKGYTPEVFGKIKRFVSPYNMDGLVNINTAEKEALMALADGIDDELAGRLIEYRDKTPFRNRSDVMKVPGFEQTGFRLQDRIIVKSDTFRVLSRGTAGGSKRDIEAVITTGGGTLYWREM